MELVAQLGVIPISAIAQHRRLATFQPRAHRELDPQLRLSETRSPRIFALRAAPCPCTIPPDTAPTPTHCALAAHSVQHTPSAVAIFPSVPRPRSTRPVLTVLQTRVIQHPHLHIYRRATRSAPPTTSTIPHYPPKTAASLIVHLPPNRYHRSATSARPAPAAPTYNPHCHLHDPLPTPPQPPPPPHIYPTPPLTHHTPPHPPPPY